MAFWIISQKKSGFFKKPDFLEQVV